MIVIEGTLWPLVFVGLGRPEDVEGLSLVDERDLAAGRGLLVAAVIAGQGEAGVRAQRAILEWLGRQRAVLQPRLRRLAWIVEDRQIRSSTSGWLNLERRQVYSAPSDVFTTVGEAVRWLLQPAAAPCGLSGSECSAMTTNICEIGVDGEAGCECIWTCSRGRTRLACRMRQQGEQDFHIEVIRNSRVYGTYQFAGRTPALVFADRLRFSFEGNGWVAA